MPIGTIAFSYRLALAYSLVCSFAVSSSAKDATIIECPDRNFSGGESFFSAAGQKLAKRLRVRQPIQFLPAKVLDPPRDITADKWNGPFCREWIDAEQNCERRSKISRRKRSAEEISEHPTDRVLCIEPIARSDLLKICGLEEMTDSLHLSDGRILNTYAQSGASIEYHPTVGRWCWSNREDTLFPPYRKNDTSTFLYGNRDISCRPHPLDYNGVVIYPPGQ